MMAERHLKLNVMLKNVVLAMTASLAGGVPHATDTHILSSTRSGYIQPGYGRARSPMSTGVTYYINAIAGDDVNVGTSPRQAWKTIGRVNRARFAPGDRILFSTAHRHQGTLQFGHETSTQTSRPITIASYGRGRATLDGGAGDGIRLMDCGAIRIINLNVVGSGRKNGSDGAGISLLRTHDVGIDNVNVSGFRIAGIATGGDVNSRITHVYAHENGAAGITTDSGYGDVPRTRNLYIGYCRADNNPGDPKNLTNHSGNGIVVGGADGGMIEYCEASNNGWDMPRDGNGPVGIWGWNSDRLTIQHCISHDNKSPGTDGGGFDFDGGVTNSVLQYNLSYHNMGCGYLLCQFPGAPPWQNNVMRYNISINDGTKNFHSGIGLWIGGDRFSGAQIYNNTIINPVHAVSTLGEVPDFVYQNNIFVAGSDVIDGTLGGGYSKSRFDNNLYWSTGTGAAYRDAQQTFATLSAWSQSTQQEQFRSGITGRWADPLVTLPRMTDQLPTDPTRLTAMSFGRLSAGSPAIGEGVFIPDHGGTDFFGRPIIVSKQPSLGAYQP
jgi:hypothetical protein